MSELSPQEQARQALEDLVLQIPPPVMDLLAQVYLYRHNHVPGDVYLTHIMLGEAKLVLDLLGLRASAVLRRSQGG